MLDKSKSRRKLVVCLRMEVVMGDSSKVEADNPPLEGKRPRLLQQSMSIDPQRLTLLEE